MIALPDTTKMTELAKFVNLDAMNAHLKILALNVQLDSTYLEINALPSALQINTEIVTNTSVKIAILPVTDALAQQTMIA